MRSHWRRKRCVLNSRNYAMSVLRKLTSDLSRNKSEEPVFIRTGFSLDDFMRRTREKKYTTDHPMELIFCTAGRTIYCSNEVVPAIRRNCDNDRHQFRRVWFMGEGDDTCKCVFPGRQKSEGEPLPHPSECPPMGRRAPCCLRARRVAVRHVRPGRSLGQLAADSLYCAACLRVV